MLAKLLTWINARKTAPPSLYQESVFRFRAMDFPDESVYGDIRTLSVVIDRIKTYEYEILKAIRCLEEDLPYIKNEQLELKTVRRCYFYLSQTDEFLNPDEAHRAFVDAAVLLLEIYERKQDALEQDGVLQSNLYRLLPIINNLIELSEALTPR